MNSKNDGLGRGFSSMDPELQREYASLGGRTAHKNGKAHTWTSETAREAGRKGAEARARNRQAAQQQRAEIQKKNHQQ